MENALPNHFVEFEDVNVDFKLKTSNAESAPVKKGLTQIRDWQHWIYKNKGYFGYSCGIPEIVNSIPTWGFNYCLVVSRRNRMDDSANSLRSSIMHNYCGLKLITFDRLVDNVRRLVNGF